MTENQALVQQHLAKVYGKASVGAPPMSVPHVDTRVLDGKQVLLLAFRHVLYQVPKTRLFTRYVWLDDAK